MKKLFIIILLLFAIVAIGLFVFILTFDVNRYKPLLIEKIEQAIDRDVRISNISLNLLPGLGLRIDGVSIKDRDKSWQDAVLKTASIEAGVKLLPLIKKDIQIENLYVRGLDITITKSSLQAPIEPIGIDRDDVDPGLTSVGALKFLVKSISMRDSTINYVDDVSEEVVHIKVDIVEALFKNVSLYGPVYINARLSLFGRGVENIKLKALLYPEFEDKNPYIKNLNLKVNLARLSLTSALNALGKTGIAQQLIGKEIRGELVINSEKICLGPKKIYDSDIRITLSRGTTDMFPVKDGLKNIELKAEMDKGDIFIQRFTGTLAGGAFLVRGDIKEVGSHQNSILDIVLQDIGVARLLPDVAPGEPYLEGELNIDVHSLATGLIPQTIANTLSAKGTMKLDKAVLKNMNILTVALDKLDMLPGLVERLKNKLPEYYRELLRQNYTAFEPLKIGFNIKDRKLFFQRAVVESDAFYLICRGYLGMNREINIHSNLFIPRDLSDAFISVVPELGYLQNTRGMITLPLAIGGRFSDISVRPDLEYVIRRLAASKGQELLEGIFRKIEPKETKVEPGEETEARKKPREVEPAEAIIRTIFDIIGAPGDREEYKLPKRNLGTNEM